MSRSEFLRGGRLAATATHEALHAALHSEDAAAGLGPLERLAADGCLAPPLHRELAREARRGRDEGDETVLELMQERLAEQAAQVAHGAAEVSAVRLVAGMRRELAETGLAGYHVLYVGSHLLVIRRAE